MTNELEFWVLALKTGITVYSYFKSGNGKITQDLKEQLTDFFEFIIQN